MAKPVEAPLNLGAWVEKYLPQSLGFVGNKEVFKGSDFIFQIIKGPNARNDFHIDPFDEIFYQIKGHIFVHFMDENSKEQKVRINEGEVFILPKTVPHSPRRPPDSVGLVIERPRKQNELDGAAWFCGKCGNLLHKVEFWLADIEVGIKETIQTFNANLELRTCKQCGAVLPDPTKIKQQWE